MSACTRLPSRGLTSGLLAGSVSDGLIRAPADWIAIWRAAITDHGWTHREVDFRAGWGEGYCSKLLCGDREPTATTILRMNRALGLRLRLEVDTEAALTP
jgi:hypothetical protein